MAEKLDMEPGCKPPRLYEPVPGGVLVWSKTSATGWTCAFVPNVMVRRLPEGSKLVPLRPGG